MKLGSGETGLNTKQHTSRFILDSKFFEKKTCVERFLFGFLQLRVTRKCHKEFKQNHCSKAMAPSMELKTGDFKHEN